MRKMSAHEADSLLVTRGLLRDRTRRSYSHTSAGFGFLAAFGFVPLLAG